MRVTRLSCATLVLAVFACHDAAAPVVRPVDAPADVQPLGYKVTAIDLGVVPGHSNTFLKDVNNKGEAVGLSYDATLVTHMLYVPPGGTAVRSVLPLGQSIVGVAGINDRGEAAGTWNGSPFGNRPRGFKWKAGVLTDIVQGSATTINTINAFGAVSGSMTNPAWSGSIADFSVPREIGFSWNGSFVERDYPAGADFVVSTWAMNDYGDAVGSMIQFNAPNGQVLWKSNTASLPFGTSGPHFSSINNSGLISGEMYDPGVGAYVPMTWTGASAPQPLPGLNAAATDINNLGEVAGYIYDPGSGNARATLWRNGQLIDLGTGPGVSAYVWSLNDLGWVVGSTTFANGTSHAMLWKVSSSPAETFTAIRSTIVQAGVAGYLSPSAVQQLLASLTTNSLPRFRAAVATLSASGVLDPVSAQIYASLATMLARRL